MNLDPFKIPIFNLQNFKNFQFFAKIPSNVVKNFPLKIFSSFPIFMVIFVQILYFYLNWNFKMMDLMIANFNIIIKKKKIFIDYYFVIKVINA